ncbi:MAG: type II toxin-antitoxin system YhaV family toxin [Phormidesmis sp.]
MARQIPSEKTIINGWAVFAHDQFLTQFETLLSEVNGLRERYPQQYQAKNATKRLEAIVKLAFDVIPQDPTRDTYCQGGTLGDENKHWFRAKFYQQYRLFFRYHLESKVIVFGWVNDPETKWAYDSKTDAYRVFKKMIERGNPPNDWDDLLSAAQSESCRLEKIMDQL